MFYHYIGVVMRYLIGGFMLLTVLPKIAYQCFVALLKEHPITVFECDYVGKNSQSIHYRVIKVNSAPLDDFDKWLHYLRGHFDLIGPKPLNVDQAFALPRHKRSRFAVAPGLLAPYSIKTNAGIEHHDELQVSCDFAQSASWHQRAQLFMMFICHSILGTKRTRLMVSSHFNLFGVALDNLTMNEALDRVETALETSSDYAARFAFVNADCANNYYRNASYRSVLNSFDSVFADGIGIKLAARWHGVNMRDNVNGTDMFPLLCERLQESGKSLYLLGAQSRVINKLVANLQQRYPALKIAGYCDGYRYNDKPQALVKHINSSGADLLLVAMGAPRQEQWIHAQWPELNVKVAMGVGGLFDFYSGEVSRAPELLRALSLEWVWRLLVQPQAKAKRYLIGNPLFIYRALVSVYQQKELNKSFKTNSQLSSNLEVGHD